MHGTADRQLPPAGKISLDHVAHFVPEVDAASDALVRFGFTLTPFSPQSHRLQPDGPLVPAGTGNRCVMLRAGYIEFLTPVADTPLAAQLRTAIARYVGVHLIAFGDPYERGVRQIHRQISILPHQGPHPGCIGGIEQLEPQAALFQNVPQPLLGHR